MKIFRFSSRSGKTMEKNERDDSPTTVTLSSYSTSRSDADNFNWNDHNLERNLCRSLRTAYSDEAAVNVRAARAWMEAMNACQPVKSYVETLNNFFESKDTNMVMEDGEMYTAEDGNKLVVATFQSFPDFKFTWGEIAIIDDNPKRVVVDQVSAEGTFTGEPYTILPGVLPSLLPTGRRNYNDMQRFELTMENGKIVLFEVFALGVHTGFSGFYVRAGGSLIPSR